MKTNMSQSIIAVIEDFLPRFTRDKVLVVSIDARLNHYDKNIEKIKGVFRGIHMAFYRPQNYVTVIMAIDKEEIAHSFNRWANFKFITNHDSEWKNEGIQSPLFKVACDMVQELEKNGAPRLPFYQYSWMNDISSIKVIPGKIVTNGSRVSLILD